MPSAFVPANAAARRSALDRELPALSPVGAHRFAFRPGRCLANSWKLSSLRKGGGLRAAGSTGCAAPRSIWRCGGWTWLGSGIVAGSRTHKVLEAEDFVRSQPPIRTIRGERRNYPQGDSKATPQVPMRTATCGIHWMAALQNPVQFPMKLPGGPSVLNVLPQRCLACHQGIAPSWPASYSASNRGAETTPDTTAPGTQSNGSETPRRGQEAGARPPDRYSAALDRNTAFLGVSEQARGLAYSDRRNADEALAVVGEKPFQHATAVVALLDDAFGSCWTTALSMPA